MNISSGACCSRPLFSHENIPLACDCSGEGAPLRGFVHGWTCRRSYGSPQLNHFAANHAAVALDLPGHGESGARAQALGTKPFARDVAACVCACSAEKVILIGHSMGGAVVLEAARIPVPRWPRWCW